jgi:hypothetical protein
MKIVEKETAGHFLKKVNLAGSSILLPFLFVRLGHRCSYWNPVAILGLEINWRNEVC